MRFEPLEVELRGVADALAPEPDEAELRDAHARIDALAERIMRIRLDHADTQIPTPTQKVFATTIASYADQLDVLEARAREAATYGGARDPASAARAVVDAARATLELRAAAHAAVDARRPEPPAEPEPVPEPTLADLIELD